MGAPRLASLRLGAVTWFTVVQLRAGVDSGEFEIAGTQGLNI